MSGMALRFFLGWAAILMAGAQFSMRFYLAKVMGGRAARRKEKSGAIATGLLLGGVGIGNLTHLHTDPTLSTFILSVGVIASAWAVENIWAAGKESGEDVTAHRRRPKR